MQSKDIATAPNDKTKISLTLKENEEFLNVRKAFMSELVNNKVMVENLKQVRLCVYSVPSDINKKGDMLPSRQYTITFYDNIPLVNKIAGVDSVVQKPLYKELKEGSAPYVVSTIAEVRFDGPNLYMPGVRSRL